MFPLVFIGEGIGKFDLNAIDRDPLASVSGISVSCRKDFGVFQGFC